MKNLILKYPFVSLIIVALTAGLIWKAEVEYHGWGGLTWLSYFHFAIPTGFGLLLLWSNAFIELNFKRRILLNIIVILYAAILYYALLDGLSFTFATGPTAMLYYFSTSGWGLFLYMLAAPICFLTLPVVILLLGSIFEQSIHLRYFLFSILGILISPFIAILILDFTNHSGGADGIHIIKSGVIIPFLVFFIGLNILKKPN